MRLGNIFGQTQGYSEIPDAQPPLSGASRSPITANGPPSRSQQLLVVAVLLTLTLLLAGGGGIGFSRVPPLITSDLLADTVPVWKETLEESMEQRNQRCKGIDWLQACDQLEGGAGARRRLGISEEDGLFSVLEESLLDSDDPSVTYDEKCLRVYRLDLVDDTTFPYHANQLLSAGGNQTMALFIQHGAMRDADKYFCSFRQLMQEQRYRPFSDVLVIAPDFNYQHDDGVLSTDAFWNGSKPWGDWRVGAESDPDCCGGPQTISSFSILDHMLGLLTNKQLYPKMDKISYVGHSAGGQMVQRYAILSELAASFDFPSSRIDMEFVIANPSSYTYLDERRFPYTCGHCNCTLLNCTCDQDCTELSMKLSVPGLSSNSVCHDRQYNHWPYGVEFVISHNGVNSIPYAVQAGLERCLHDYKSRDVVYMVGQNDTCNDGLPTCDASCWKKQDFLPEEWPCFRNHMDSRCPAMLEGPNRRTRGLRFKKYLELYYGRPTHVLHVIPGVGHNATAMFGSPVGLQELFD
jgi:hypothetical protein